MRHSQYTANPLNPPYQGDFEDVAPIEIIGECILISRVYYIFSIHHKCQHALVLSTDLQWYSPYSKTRKRISNTG